jgi:uncharacterized membrane protein required for colicin V production
MQVEIVGVERAHSSPVGSQAHDGVQHTRRKTMNLLDLFILISLLYYVIRGFFGGLIRMTLELLGLLVGVYVAAAFYRQLTNLIDPLFLGFHTLAAIVSYFIIYLAIYQLFAYAINWFDETQWKKHPSPFIERIRTSFGGLIEKGGGVLVGLIKGNIVIGIVILLLRVLPIFNWLGNLVQTSLFVKYVVNVASFLLPNLPAELGG